MLTAATEGKTLYIDDHPPAFFKHLSDAKQLFCPDCGEPLVFKECKDRSDHFAHANSDCVFPFREAESIEHESGKKAVYEWLKTLFSESYIEKRVELTNQRSDTYAANIKSAFEFQCSPIQAATWEQRNALYRYAEIYDFWILGYSMHKYYSPSNTFAHKINQLEESLLKRHGEIIYFDVLTKMFVFLIPEKQTEKCLIGAEYFFKPSEVFIKNGVIASKYDFLWESQAKRKSQVLREVAHAKETDAFLTSIRKSDIEPKKVLASKKQIGYIKYLLHHQKKQIPYKLNGLLKSEADSIIKKLEVN